MKPFVYTVITAALLTACTTPRYTGAPYTVIDKGDKIPDSREPITQSLFNDKQATISEENIQKILEGHYKLPQQLRVAVVRIDNSSNNRYYYGSYWNDEQYLKTQQAYLDLLADKLKQSQRVTAVNTIPDLLLTKPQNFTSIREAAVRLQADMVVVYTINTDIYSKYRLFTKADIKAFATTQLLVLDVRTGLVPFSTVVTKDQLSKKQDADLDNNEASNRIQKEAVLLTLEEIGKQLNDFLKGK